MFETLLSSSQRDRLTMVQGTGGIIFPIFDSGCLLTRAVCSICTARISSQPSRLGSESRTPIAASRKASTKVLLHILVGTNFGPSGSLTVESNGANNLVLDTGSAGGSVNIGTTNATSVNLGISTGADNFYGSQINNYGNVAIEAGNTLDIVSGSASITGASSGGANTLTVNNHTSGGSPLVVENANTPVFTIANGGNITATNNFTVQGSGGLTIGSSTNNGQLILNSGNTTTTVVSGVPSSSVTVTLPTSSGTICTTLSCVTGTSSDYIKNQSSVTQSANYNIQGISNTVSAVIEAASGSSNILNLENNAGSIVASFSDSGNLTANAATLSSSGAGLISPSVTTPDLNTTFSSSTTGTNLIIQSGSVSGSSGTGANVDITGGSETASTGTGGDVNINGGSGSTIGSVNIGSSTTGNINLDTSTLINGANLTVGGNTALNGNQLTSTASSLNIFNTSVTSANLLGSASTINIGASNASLIGGGALTIESGGSNTALNLLSNGSGSVNIDTGSTTGVINLGATNAQIINVATNNLVAQTVNLGSSDAGTNLVLQGGISNLSINNNGLTIATSSVLTNNSATVFGASVVANQTASGQLSMNVNGVTTFSIAQTTASLTFTLPSPTVTTSGRIIFITNTGTASFSLYGIDINPGQTEDYFWNGSAWTINDSGVTGAYIQNTYSSSQSPANIDIQSASSQVAAVIQGASGQNITNFNASSGSTVLSVLNNGSLQFNQNSSITSTANLSITTGTSGILNLGTSNTATINLGYSSNSSINLQSGTGASAIQQSLTPSGLDLRSANYVNNLSVINDGTTGTLPTIINGYLPALSVVTSEVTGSRPLFFGYNNGSSGYDSFLTSGACGAFTQMCVDLGNGSTIDTALVNEGSTLYVGGGPDGNFYDVYVPVAATFNSGVYADGGYIGSSTNLTVDSTTGGTLSLGSSAATTVNVGTNPVSSGNEAINIGSGSTSSGADVVSIGSSNGASSVLLSSGTGNINLASSQVSNSGVIITKGSANTSTSAFAIQGSAGSSFNDFTDNNTSDIVQVGSSSANTNSILFGLNVFDRPESQIGNAFLGAMYYSTKTNSFRCYEGSTPAWQNCAMKSGGVSSVGVLDGGTANSAGLTISSGVLYAQSASITYPGMVNTTSQSFSGTKTLTANITQADSGSIFGNFSAGGVIGTATTSVDIYSSIDINQTTNGQTLTLPVPSAGVGRVVYINNIGTAAFTMYNSLVSPDTSTSYIYAPTGWQVVSGQTPNNSGPIIENQISNFGLTTTLTNDPSFTFTIQANQTWYFSGTLITQSVSAIRYAVASNPVSGSTGLSCSSYLANNYYGYLSNGTSCSPSYISIDSNEEEYSGGTGGVSNGGNLWFGGEVNGGSNGTTINIQFSSSAGSGTILSNSFLEAYRVVGADYAETYYNNTGKPIYPGNVVALNGTGVSQINLTNKAYDKNVIGVVSTRPGEVIGANDGVGAPVVVGLAGRVPVKVDTQNGPILPGDYLVPSSTPGVAMKATSAGMSIGQALTGYTGKGVGSLMLFIKNTYYPGNGQNNTITQLNNLSSSTANLSNGQLVDKINLGNNNNVSQITIGSVKSGSQINLQSGNYSLNLSNNGLALDTNQVASGDISFGGQHNRLINVLQSATGNGANLTLNAGSSLSGNGGNLILQPGSSSSIDGSNGSVIVKAGTGLNSLPLFMVQNSNGLNLLSIEANNGLVRIGNAATNFNLTGLGNLFVSGTIASSTSIEVGNQGNGLSFNANQTVSSNNGLFLGTSRPLKTINEVPQYVGMVTSNNQNGQLTSGFDNTPGQFHSYYNWTTNSNSAQTESMIVRIPVPRNFSSFSKNDQICYNVWSNSNKNTIMTDFYDTNDTAQPQYNASPTQTNLWQTKCTNNIGGTITVNGNSYMTVMINLTANPNSNIRIGEFSFNYLSAF